MTDLGAAVAMLDGVRKIQGVVRFLQLSEERCLIDGTIDGLEPGPHGLHVHTLGDLTQDCSRYTSKYSLENFSIAEALKRHSLVHPVFFSMWHQAQTLKTQQFLGQC